MRIDQGISFPHPILSAETQDYSNGSFDLVLSVQESANCNDATLRGNLMLDECSIHELLDSGKAKSGLMVTCRETYLDRFEERPPGDISILLGNGIVRGTVHVRAVVIAAQDDLKLDSEHIDKEFPDGARIVNTGDFLALSDELRFEAGLEKLAPLESIFTLVKHEDVPKGSFRINPDEEAIQIMVHPDLHAFLGLLRGRADMCDVMLSSVFLPAVMSVLDIMRGESDFQDKRWHGVMTARCKAEGIDIENQDLAESAQKLLDAPLNSLQGIIERLDR
ncbi:hypothetical protein [Rhodanobacter soli]|uniref:hypothetical protein n=1 Tax=Rhodanobacter soli TaxID=590609 RepID=UPI0031DA50A9